MSQDLLAAQNTVFWGGAALREDAGEYLVQHGVKLVAWGGSCVFLYARCSHSVD